MSAPDVTVATAVRPGLSPGRWVITFAATVVSTYALDAVATAAGVLLTASQWLRGLDSGVLLAFVAATYIVWGAGLRVNLKANWRLLEETGTSTNALSKGAYDVVKLRTESIRVRRIASGIGYVGAELIKEVPYYIAALGTALVSDSVSSSDALIFLGGANLGAAAYEYGLGRITGVYLRRKAPRASFETDWVPKEYLADYYSAVEQDELETIAFFVDAMKHADPDEPVLFFGVGPTLHHVFLAASRSSEIHLGDYLAVNLGEIERWIERDPQAHDWRPFVRYTLECEGLVSPTAEDIDQREELTRAKITRLLVVDARNAEPLREQYSTVISAYCADSATGDRAEWETNMNHIAGLVRPGGVFITAALRRSRAYLVGGKSFPSANVDEHDMRMFLESSFERDSGSVEVRDLAEQGSHGYSSIVLAWARKHAEVSQRLVERSSSSATSRLGATIR